MSENAARPNAPLTAWGTELAAAFCERCHASFLVTSDTPLAKCPNCFQSSLEITSDSLPGAPHPYPPELILPSRLSRPQLLEAIHGFAASIPFAPPGLAPAELRSRLATIYLPMWLVDGIVSAYWQAEVGFDYRVISHQETYNQSHGGWKSSEVQEPRVRWENRVGKINRGYQNVATPALDDAADLEKRLGRFQLDYAQSYSPDYIQQAFIRVPDRTPKTSWSEAAVAFQKTAADDCQRACEAGHIRQFRWKARFTRLNWTLLLLPVYAAYYQDDHGETQVIRIHGQTGAVCGARRSSSRRAGRVGLAILAIGVFLFLAGLLLDGLSETSLSLDMAATVLAVLGISGILAACIPYVISWDFNRRQKLEEAKT